MSPGIRTAALRVLILPAVLLLAALSGGCGDSSEPAETTPLEAQTNPASDPGGTPRPAEEETANRGDAGDGTGRPAGGREIEDPNADLAPRPTDTESDDAAERRAARAAERAYAAYIAAINDRDGRELCRLLPGNAADTLRTSAERGGCARRVRASIGYADPRGIPVWKRTILSGFEATQVEPGLTQARVTGSIVTEFADRTQPSVESDIAYLEVAGGEWRLRKPTGALYRALGKEPPPSVITPP